jgi:hypothetical protein
MNAEPRATANCFFLAFNPEFNPEECPLKFRLTYEGRLEGNGSPRHKHEIRKAFHPQLKRLWQVDPNLRGTKYMLDQGDPRVVGGVHYIPGWQGLADNFERLGYKFVPVAMERTSLLVALEILFLRPEAPGGVLHSADLDNRLKTLFDALRMPNSKDELGGYEPDAEEQPFFVLLEDDRLLSHVSIETDVLLQPTPTAQGKFLPNDCRLIITASLKPYEATLFNSHFV